MPAALIATNSFRARGLAAWISRALDHVQNPKELEKIKKEVKTLCQRFPMYTERLKA